MFGITCAPEIFQKIMEQILNECEGCLIYIDDIIVYASNKVEHNARLQKVLARLANYNVKLNKAKCMFGVSALNFLGHHLSSAGIKPTVDRVKGIEEFREPSNGLIM